MSRYLTKSRFKLAYDCPRKLYYNEHSEYGNTMRESDFMAALAEGGFQIGALAKLYYDGGVDLEELNIEAATAKTLELLKQENVTIYEATLKHGPYLVRIDILKKRGQQIDLIEVKSKSHDFEGDDFFKKKRGKKTAERGTELQSDWEPYLIDVAFQVFVSRLALPKMTIRPFLCLVDKRVTVEVDGLHQCFLLKKVNGRSHVEVNENVRSLLSGPKILSTQDVSQEVEFLLTEEVFPGEEGTDLPSYAKLLSGFLSGDQKGFSRPGPLCKTCEFRIPQSLEGKGAKSGFKECWVEAGFLTDDTKDSPTILDLWDNRRKETQLADNKVLLTNLEEDDLGEIKESDSGLSRTERQWLQVKNEKSRDDSPFFERDYLEVFLSSLKYPLHFIDFETTRTAIPFHKGMRPNEQLAYQFSHHVMEKDGRVSHQDQYLHTERGAFPNFEFTRALMMALSRDEGTVFRYSHHENTTLNDIIRQLEVFKPTGYSELIEFIETITKVGKQGDEDHRVGERNMLDLCDTVKKGYFSRRMGGSNSIKVVTPSILSESKFLQEKYSQPIYGQGCEIPSLNFGPTAWVRMGEHGKILDPYKNLPPVDIDDGFRLTDIEAINEGGGASIAWARMQFTEMSSTERRGIADGLLRYCELDTLSMVWLLEYLKERVHGC